MRIEGQNARLDCKITTKTNEGIEYYWLINKMRSKAYEGSSTIRFSENTFTRHVSGTYQCIVTVGNKVKDESNYAVVDVLCKY